MEEDSWKEMLFQIVFWIAVIAAIGTALYFVLPPAIEAVGAAVGLAGALMGGGAALSSAVASWVVPTAAAGLAVGGASVALTVVIRIVRKAKESPFDWLAPVLGVASSFVVDFCEELYPYEGVFRVVFAGVAGALVVGGGFLWRAKDLGVRLISVPIFLLAPGLVLYWAGAKNWSNGILYTIGQIGASTWGALFLFLVLLVVIAALGYLSGPESDKLPDR